MNTLHSNRNIIRPQDCDNSICAWLSIHSGNHKLMHETMNFQIIRNLSICLMAEHLVTRIHTQTDEMFLKHPLNDQQTKHQTWHVQLCCSNTFDNNFHEKSVCTEVDVSLMFMPWIKHSDEFSVSSKSSLTYTCMINSVCSKLQIALHFLTVVFRNKSDENVRIPWTYVIWFFSVSKKFSGLCWLFDEYFIRCN